MERNGRMPLGRMPLGSIQVLRGWEAIEVLECIYKLYDELLKVI